MCLLPADGTTLPHVPRPLAKPSFGVVVKPWVVIPVRRMEPLLVPVLQRVEVRRVARRHRPSWPTLRPRPRSMHKLRLCTLCCDILLPDMLLDSGWGSVSDVGERPLAEPQA